MKTRQMTASDSRRAAQISEAIFYLSAAIQRLAGVGGSPDSAQRLIESGAEALKGLTRSRVDREIDEMLVA